MKEQTLPTTPFPDSKRLSPQSTGCNKISPASRLARECMVEALIQLAERKPLSSITISELTRKAGVARMTYYRNYSSKEEIFEQHMRTIVADFREETAARTPRDYGSYENVLRCFSYFLKHRRFIQCILKAGMGNLLLDALNSYLLEAYYPEGGPLSLYYTLKAYAGSLCNVYVAWLQNDCQEPIEEMAQILCRLYHPEPDGARRAPLT